MSSSASGRVPSEARPGPPRKTRSSWLRRRLSRSFSWKNTRSPGKTRTQRRQVRAVAKKDKPRFCSYFAPSRLSASLRSFSPLFAVGDDEHQHVRADPKLVVIFELRVLDPLAL